MKKRRKVWIWQWRRYSHPKLKCPNAKMGLIGKVHYNARISGNVELQAAVECRDEETFTTMRDKKDSSVKRSARCHVFISRDSKKEPENSITYAVKQLEESIKDAVHGRNGSQYSFAGIINATINLKVKSSFDWISDSVDICDRVSK